MSADVGTAEGNDVEVRPERGHLGRPVAQCLARHLHARAVVLDAPAVAEAWPVWPGQDDHAAGADELAPSPSQCSGPGGSGKAPKGDTSGR